MIDALLGIFWIALGTAIYMVFSRCKDWAYVPPCRGEEQDR